MGALDSLFGVHGPLSGVTLDLTPKPSTSKLRTVQLMGGADSNEVVPPFEEGMERWGMNNLWMKVVLKPRFANWTRWFDLHPLEHIAGRKHNILEWERQQERPIWRFVDDPLTKNLVIYPHAAVRAHFGGTRFFCSGFDWEMALAIYEGFERIQLYGWRMSNTFKYAHQISSGQFWIQKALAAGIVVESYSRSTLVGRPRKVSEPTEMDRCLMYGLETVDRSKLYHAA